VIQGYFVIFEVDSSALHCGT